MTETSQTFVLGLCFLGLFAWIPLVITFGFIGWLRKMIGWIETRMDSWM